ncbi:MAG: hypothetical protein ABIE22_01735 [archaeon]
MGMRKLRQLKTKKLEISSFQLLKGRGAQLKIQQMAFMLMAIVLFFILAGLFYLTIQASSLAKRSALLEQEEAVRLASMLANSPEFSCGVNCIDMDRMLALKDRAAYDYFWPVSSIEVRKVYPAEGREIECDMGNYPNCNLLTVYDEEAQSERTAESYVALCRREKQEGYIYNRCEIGKLLVGYRVKNG